MPTSQRINESSALQNPAVCSDWVQLYPRTIMHHQPVWNRKKEILIGTTEKVSPTRATSRRVYKISKALGPMATYYFWMLERLYKGKDGNTDRTNFKIAEAAAAVGTTVRNIKRYNSKLKKAGWISVIQRRYKEQNTYATYILNPINDLIKDYGVSGNTRQTPHQSQNMSSDIDRHSDSFVTASSDTGVPAKRAFLKASGSSVSSSPEASCSSNPSGSKSAEAGRFGFAVAAPADFVAQGDERVNLTNQPSTLKSRILKFLEKEQSVILGWGFIPKDHSSLLNDITMFIKNDLDWWIDFETNMWPLLQEKWALGKPFIKKRKHNLGFGWLFKTSKNHGEESNLQVCLLSAAYDGVPGIPENIYSSGQKVRVYGRSAVIVERIDFNKYWVCSDNYTTTEDQVANKFLAPLNEIKADGQQDKSKVLNGWRKA